MRPVPALFLAAALMSCSGDTPTATTPVATATPTPTPPPTTTLPVFGTGQACGLPRMAECGATGGSPGGDPPGVYGCCQKRNGGGQWAPIIQEAIDVLKNEQPQIFGDNNHVIDRIAYINGLARVLERDFKVCAVPGFPGDEVGIKTSNDFSEQYDVYTADAKSRYPGYQVTCIPARF
jgi:hypothetical protein